ncbi:hypothetical protein DERP_014052 [Dermatophagoides pteronyssinus]|uniref:Uncharacterized protein LOC113795425 n=2 Tax=Dermatophagoides pteronyssinus TaxID=6956 RepID=A0A6P6Y7L2_DERPT|nr:uncharacterized protein LOC113795425 [Dermatophagoides pteronyssinus]XP_027201408.1 uncharacterized protein LOC113795425 [Dermatophagoides pteronyssinus]KAH9420433.1 hypothetical protein DERP_014052 [Dermatophagoides pteronyssinus]
MQQQQSKRRFIIYLIINNSNKMEQQRPIGLIQSSEIIGSCNLGRSRNMAASNNNKLNDYRLEIKPFDEHHPTGAELQQMIYQNDFNIIHFESKDADRNLLELSMDNDVGHHFHWLLRSPCMMLVNSIIRLQLDLGHGPVAPVPESNVIKGMEEIFLENDAQLCFDSSSFQNQKFGGGGAINLFTKSNLIKQIVKVDDQRRPQIASIFYCNNSPTTTTDAVPGSNIQNAGGSNEVNKRRPTLQSVTSRSKNEPDYVIYYGDKNRIKPVAIICGQIQQLLPNELLSMTTTEFDPGELLQMPETKLELRNDLTNEINRKDWYYLCKHSSLVRVQFLSIAYVHSLQPTKCYFKSLIIPSRRFSIVIAGFVGIIGHRKPMDPMDLFNASKILSGGTRDHVVEIVVDEECLVYIGDHFMFIMAKQPRDPNDNNLLKMRFKSKSN